MDENQKNEENVDFVEITAEQSTEPAQETTEELKVVDSDTTEGAEVENANEQKESTEEANKLDEVDQKANQMKAKKVYTEEEFNSKLNSKIESRFKREQKKHEKEMEPYKKLVSILHAGGFNGDISQISENLTKAYKDQGVEIPEFRSGLTDSEQKALAEMDAKEVIEAGEDEMRERFTELYRKPQRTVREEREMYLIGKEHSKRLAKKDLLEMGANPDEVMNDPEFIDFASKMGPNVSTKEIYKYFQKLKGNIPQKPARAGSVKSNESDDGKIDYSSMSSKDFQKELDKVLNN